MRKSVATMLLVLIILTALCIAAPSPVKADSPTIVVPDDYATIQEAIAQANEGDMVYVKSGTYSGSILIDKPLSLIGEDKDSTIINDWVVNGTAAIVIKQNNVKVTGFTIHNPSPTTIWNKKRGIHLLHVNHCNISDNNILRSDWGAGIWLYESSENIIVGNTVESGASGIRLDFSSENFIFNNSIKGNLEGIALRHSHNNTLSANFLENNNDGVLLSEAHRNEFYANNISSYDHGVRIGDYEDYVTHAANNTFYHNNFIHNAKNVESYLVAIGVNYFDNGKEGNYYSNYKGTDDNGDGIGDMPYMMVPYMTGTNFTDHYPLMAPFDIDSVTVQLPEWAAPLSVRLISPINTTYASTNVTLEFTVNKQTSWMGYSLDGKDNVTITGNISIAGLSSGLHNITVYAKDTFENTGTSETICFSIKELEPFPIALVATASGASATIIGIGLLIYLKKRKR